MYISVPNRNTGFVLSFSMLEKKVDLNTVLYTLQTTYLSISYHFLAEYIEAVKCLTPSVTALTISSLGSSNVLLSSGVHENPPSSYQVLACVSRVP